MNHSQRCPSTKGLGNKKSAPDYRIGSIKDLEKRYNFLVSKLQTEVDPKVLSSYYKKNDTAKRNF